MSSFVLMLREGVEAAIIVAILIGYLHRLDRRAETRWVWGGTIAAVLVSIAVGLVLWNTVGGLEGTAEEIAEGAIAFAAAGLLTWMIFWLGRQARFLRMQLEGQIDTALKAGGATALAVVAFVAVLREGVESALFLISTTVGTEAAAMQLIGGLAGLGAAIVIGVLFYAGSTAVDLRSFFRATGVLIVLFAAGLVAKGVHEFQESGLLPTVNEHVWDLGILEPSTSLTGRFLSSLFGWTPRPSLLMAVAYVGYLVPILIAFLRMSASPAGRRSAPAEVSA